LLVVSKMIFLDSFVKYTCDLLKMNKCTNKKNTK